LLKRTLPNISLPPYVRRVFQTTLLTESKRFVNGLIVLNSLFTSALNYSKKKTIRQNLGILLAFFVISCVVLIRGHLLNKREVVTLANKKEEVGEVAKTRLRSLALSVRINASPHRVFSFSVPCPAISEKPICFYPAFRKISR